MKTTRTYLASVILGFFLISNTSHAEVLYSVNGKIVNDVDLSSSMKLKFHELQDELFHKKASMVDNAILDQYIEGQVKKTGKTRADIEKKLFDVKEPSDKEAKKWFEDNKQRIPPQYKFEQIKADIVRQIKTEKQKESYTVTLAKIKKDQKIKILIQAPVAPQISIKTDGFPVKGNKSAKVTIVEFADYQCPHCKEAGEVMKKVMKKYAKEAKLVFIDFPVNRSGISEVVAHGGVCADEQGKYWEYNELAFSKQTDLTKESPAELAKSLKLDVSKFTACLKSKKPEAKVKMAKDEAERVGVAGTPAIFVDGRKIHGYDEDEIVKAIESAL